MAWARLDDGFHDHPKVDGLSLAAVGLYTLCLTWAHRHRRTAVLPGHITEARVRKLAGAKAGALAAELLTSGLWEPEDGLGGYVIHDFTDYLPKERDPDERRQAGRKGAAKRWAADSNPGGKPDGNLPSDSMASDSSRASAPAFPTRPVNEPSNDGSQNTTAQTIVAEWIDRTSKRPPGAVVGQVAKLTGQMLSEGIDPDDVRRGLAAWMTKGLHPSALPSVVNEVMNAAPIPLHKNALPGPSLQAQMMGALSRPRNPS